MTSVDLNEEPTHPKPRKSSKVMKWMLGIGVCGFLLLLLAGLFLTYWFPSDTVRQELEVRLSEMLEGTVTIQSLAFNLLTGIVIHQVEFSKPDQPPLTLDRLTLDYSLLGLLQGKFTINEVSLDHANISLNLPEMTKETPPQETAPQAPQAEPTLPAFPISIALDTFAITDSNIEVFISPDLHIQLENLNFRSAGALDKETVNLTGALEVEQLAVTFQGKHLQLPLHVSFDTHIHFPTRHLELKHLSIASTPAFQVTLSGTVNNFLTQQDIQLSLHDTHFNLEHLRKLVNDFVPPEFASATMSGTLTPAISLTGSLPDAQFTGTIQGAFTGTHIQVHLPGLAMHLGPTNFSVKAENIRVQKSQPTEGTVSAKISLHDLTFQSYRIENLELALGGDGFTAGPFSGNLHVSGTTTIPPDIIGTSIALPFDLTFKTKGNHQTRQIEVKNLDLDLGPYGSLHVKAEIKPHASPKPGMDASLELHVQPYLHAWLPLIPQDQLQGLIIHPSPKHETFVLRATGSLHDDFQPEWATAIAALKLAPIKATWGNKGIRGNLEELTFLLSSKYQEQEGAFRGTIGFSTRLSDLQATDNLSLDTIHIILKSSFQGNVSQTFQPVHFRSHDRLQVTLRNIMYADPSLTATLPSLKISLDTKEDLITQDFILKRLSLVSEDILDLSIRGRFSQATQQFTIDLQAPLLHIGNLLPHLSGPLMAGMETINPKGRLGLTLQAAGHIPEKTDLENFALPIDLKTTLTLHDLAGAVAGYHIQGGNGMLSFGYSPNAIPQTQLTTGIHIDRIGLPDTLPVSELTNTALQLNIQSPDLNEVHIDSLHVTSQGIDLSIKAGLVGLREFLSSSATPRGTQLAKLFVQLQGKLGIDLEPFQQVLEAYGLSGKGKVQVGISMHKQEQGDLNASLEIGADKLSFVHNGTELQNMNGSLHIRKSLRWDMDNPSTTATHRFLPSDRIAQLKTFSGKGRKISIDAITLGPLTIQHLSTHIAFQQQTLRIQNLVMNLLGGGIGGHVTIAIEHPLRVSAGFEIADLDINQLLKTTKQIAGDSTIAATITLDALFQDETGAIDLSRLACRIDVTHIGAEALDRLLVFLDPEGRRPALSTARAQLKLANPSHVHIVIARGQLNVVIQFQGSLIPTFELNRIPITKMKHLEKLTAAIPNWKSLMPLLNMIGADTYSFSPEGELVLK